MDALERAIKALANGEPIMVFDDESRESEVDLVYYAPLIDYGKIYEMRVIAGGLICFATSWSIAKNIGLRWGDEIISLHKPLKPLTQKRLSYGDRPAFTIWVNHASVKTGITDNDRSITIRELSKVVKLYTSGDIEGARRKFLEEFQAPGHVPILAARGLRDRRGHTELVIALALHGGLEPSMVLAEMLSRGKALSIDEARSLSEKKNWPLVTGSMILEVCRNDEVCWSG